jgi:putative ABC transport system substrate-binding protein
MLPEALLKLAEEYVANDPFFESRREQITALAAHRHSRSILGALGFEAEGLIIYGPDLTVALRQAGIYAGRILRGAKPQVCP